MYHAKIHPEQYSNTLTEPQMKQLHKSIHHICSTAVDLLGDSDQFPEDWLFKHRWGKGKKDQANKLPNGEKIAFLTVGGRTSAVVPSAQKKTGPVTKGMDEEDLDVSGTEKVNGEVAGEPVVVKTKVKPNSSAKRRNPKEEDQTIINGSGVGSRASKKGAVPNKEDDEVGPKSTTGSSRKRKAEESIETKTSPKKVNEEAVENSTSKKGRKTEDSTLGRRRSGRLRG
jgi:formamidopyrimidine-DNA glycosylase